MFLGFTLWISTKVTGKTFQPWAKYRPSGIVASYIHAHINFLYTIYIYFLYTRKKIGVPSRQWRFWKGRGMVEKGGIVARIAESKRCAHRSSRYRLCTFEVSRPGKTVGKSRGCVPKECGGMAVRDGQVARKHFASCLTLGSNSGWLKSTRKPRGFFDSCVGNYGEFDRSENISEYLKINIFFYPSIRYAMMEILFHFRFLRERWSLRVIIERIIRNPLDINFSEMRLKFISIIRKI